MQVNSVTYYVMNCRGSLKGTVAKIVRSGRLRWTELVLKIGKARRTCRIMAQKA